MAHDLITRFVPARVRHLRSADLGGADRARLLGLASGLPDVINLNSGDPDLTAAPVAVDAAVAALRAGKTRYAFGGVPELRAALTRKLAVENNVTVDPERQLIFTNGSAEAASAIFQTILEPGDEVLTTDPYYSGHVGNVMAARGTTVLVPTRGENLWEPDPDDVERRITPRTKAFVFANPGNPTAAVYRRETLQALLDIARKHNILMVPDELFERYVYDGHRHVSMASLPGAADHVVTINGFSKSYCMTGWRLGWIVAPTWLADALSQVRYALSMTAATHNMYGAAAALSDEARPYYEEVYRTYGERRAYFYGAFTAMGLPQRVAPAAVVGMSDIRATGQPAMVVAEAFIREGRVLLWPGTAFGPGGEGYIRVGLIQPLDRLKEVIRRVEPIVARWLGEAPPS
ncbi:MAG: pyridoxal phosphate-dependent aminotransferase [Armatimonadota bacterium]|nr:pyridoxal phosphate-dependent aminotransferase [Armatimonadota bacterium]